MRSELVLYRYRQDPQGCTTPFEDVEIGKFAPVLRVMMHMDYEALLFACATDFDDKNKISTKRRILIGCERGYGRNAGGVMVIVEGHSTGCIPFFLISMVCFYGSLSRTLSIALY